MPWSFFAISCCSTERSWTRYRPLLRRSAALACPVRETLGYITAGDLLDSQVGDHGKAVYIIKRALDHEIASETRAAWDKASLCCAPGSTRADVVVGVNPPPARWPKKCTSHFPACGLPNSSADALVITIPVSKPLVCGVAPAWVTYGNSSVVIGPCSRGRDCLGGVVMRSFKTIPFQFVVVQGQHYAQCEAKGGLEIRALPLRCHSFTKYLLLALVLFWRYPVCGNRKVVS